MEVNEYKKLLESKVYPAFERIKKEFETKGFLNNYHYGYYPCRSMIVTLIFDESMGWNVDAMPTKTTL
jgi:5-methyltetrahydrofolate--homocysteine methyltransferase